jgi:hypothetical protein
MYGNNQKELAKELLRPSPLLSIESTMVVAVVATNEVSV